MKRTRLKSKRTRSGLNPRMNATPSVESPVKNIKNTRTRIAYETSQHWNDIPVVIIKRLLERSPVYTALTDAKIYFNSKRTYQEIKKSFEASNDKSYKCPRFLYVDFKHRGQDGRIRVEYQDNKVKWSATLTKPILQKYYPRGYHNNAKPKGSKFAEGTVQKIEDAITEALPVLAENANCQDINKKLADARATFKKNTEEALQQDFYVDPDYSYRGSDYNIKRGKNFTMSFKLVNRIDYENQPTDPEAEMYIIEGLGGTYTLDDVRTLIKFVCSNPRAIAERLIHG